MEKQRKLELIQRALGLRHKIKVHDSMTPPQTHEDLSLMMLAKWELEDELKAIETLLERTRGQAVDAKVKSLMSENEGEASSRMQAKAKKKSAK
jgi:hypothetical protein